MTRLAVLLLALLCTACQTSWPSSGCGGMAETKWPPQSATNPPSGLPQRLTCTLGRLEALHAASVDAGSASGEVGLLDITAARAKREYAGLLYRDSAVTLAELDIGIEAVRRDIVPEPPLPGECA